MAKDDKEFDVSDVIGGHLNIFGLNLDLGKLLSSPEGMKDRLEELRERLKQAGGKEALSDEEWRSGVNISGQFRTRGIFGEKEFHFGTAGPSTRTRGAEKAAVPVEAVEPAADVFYEDEGVTIVAEVPGVELSDLELGVKNNQLSLSTRPGARRSYLKEIKLTSRVDAKSLKATCRNGVLEVHLQKRRAEGDTGNGH